ncbi:MAG: hypothetical protein K2W99_03120 [Chthoniobacterales bacterium]|nr:hypothetical protein [Chthoniobacterales bacterium]
MQIKQKILLLAAFLFLVRTVTASELMPTPGISIEETHTLLDYEKVYKINITNHPRAIWSSYGYIYGDLIAPEIVLVRGQKRHLRVHTNYLSKDLVFSVKKNNFSSIPSILSLTEIADTMLERVEKEKNGDEPIIDWGELSDGSARHYCRKWEAISPGEVVLNFSLMIEGEKFSLLWPTTLKIPIKVIEKEGKNHAYSRAPSV